MAQRNPKTIQSVERACAILFSFSREHPRWRVSELSEVLGLHISTTSRLLATLKKLGLVKKDPLTLQYELSLRILELARVVISQLDLVKVALPYVTSLVERRKESAFLVVLDGSETVIVAQVSAPRVLTPRQYVVGMRHQASAASAGKLLLAHGPQSVVDKLIEEGFHTYTDYTITSPQELRDELEKALHQGYAIANQELEIGIFAVSAPIWDSDGEVTAALSLSGPPERMSNEHLPQLIDDVRQTALQISEGLGWLGPDSKK